MLEFLFGILPLIFVCSAIGILLLNFPAVSAYLVYVLSMMIRPQELYETSQQTLTPIKKPQKAKANILLPFIRISTLFKVLFLPDLNIDSLTSNKKEEPEQVLRSIYSEKAQEEINKYQIKTYSAHSVADHSKFRYSYEPVDAVPLSSEFKKAFPDLTKKITIQDRETQTQQPLVPPLNNGETKIILPAIHDNTHH